MELERFNYFCNRIREAKASGETDTKLGRVLAKWKDHLIPIQRDGKWLLDGFIMTFKRDLEILNAIDPSISPDVPPHLLDPAQIAYFYGIKLEDFSGFPGQTIEVGCKRNDTHEEFGEPPQEVGTAEAAEILGVSKVTVLKLKAAGLLEYRNMAPPDSSRPVFAFTVRSVMELRTNYETDEPSPKLPKQPYRRQAKGKRKYKYIDYD